MNGPPASTSPPGSLLASAGTDGTRIWRTSTGELLAVLRGHGFVSAVLFLRDGRLLTGGIDGAIHTWPGDTASLVAIAKTRLAGTRAPEVQHAETTHRLRMLLRAGDAAAAGRLGRTLVDRGKAQRDASLLEATAWEIVDPQAVIAHRDLELALEAATAAVEFTGGKNWEALRTLARAQATKGNYQQAIAGQLRAIDLVDHPELRKVLTEYQQQVGR